MSAISSSSVETITLSKHALFSAAAIDHAIIGFPPNSLIFFLGIRLLPPRAGITANFMIAASMQAQQLPYLADFRLMSHTWASLLPLRNTAAILGNQMR